MKTQTHSLNHSEMEGNFLTRWFHRQEVAFEKTHYGHMVIFLTLQSCLGSIACMYTLQNNGGDVLLIASAAITMWSNAMFISQTKAKWSLLVFYASILINLAVILINIF